MWVIALTHSYENLTNDIHVLYSNAKHEHFKGLELLVQQGMQLWQCMILTVLLLAFPNPDGCL